jgi:hypothetical protein
MRTAMSLKAADRVPLMCQLSIGHYFLFSGIDPFDIWFRSESFADALIKMADKYSFDGILVNLPGRDKDFEKYIKEKNITEDGLKITWKDNSFTLIPGDENPVYYNSSGKRNFPSLEEIDPAKLFYVEPWDITGVSYPYKWGFEEENTFPSYISDTIREVKAKAPGKSIHAEIFSPWSQFMDLLNYENALLALIDDPVKVKEALSSLTMGALELARIHATEKVDAILISSAFAGAGFISKEDYEEFVLPFEKKIISELKKDFDIPVYTHICGSIGDRLHLITETGTNGIDTLDPPPLGTVELKEAKKFLSGKAFIKGNIDPVNTLLNGTVEEIKEDVITRIETAKGEGGFILSAACSVAPHTEPAKIELLHQLVEEYGKY